MADINRIYSTGEVAQIIGKTGQHCKNVASKNGISVPRVGDRGDWLWSWHHIEQVKRLVESGVWK